MLVKKENEIQNSSQCDNSSNKTATSIPRKIYGSKSWLELSKSHNYFLEYVQKKNIIAGGKFEKQQWPLIQVL